MLTQMAPQFPKIEKLEQEISVLFAERNRSTKPLRMWDKFPMKFQPIATMLTTWITNIYNNM